MPSAPMVCRPRASRVCGAPTVPGVGFVCLCSYWVICSDLIMTQLSLGLLAQEGRGRGGGSWEGIVLLSHPKEGRAQSPCAWKPECPGVPTPCESSAHSHLENTPSPLPCLAETCPIGLIGSPHTLPKSERRLAWGAGESGVRRAGDRLQGQHDGTRMPGIWRGPHSSLPWEWGPELKHRPLILADHSGEGQRVGQHTSKSPIRGMSSQALETGSSADPLPKAHKLCDSRQLTLTLCASVFLI